MTVIKRSWPRSGERQEELMCLYAHNNMVTCVGKDETEERQ